MKELAGRNYSDPERPVVNYVLLFLPNEQLTGFIHEHDPGCSTTPCASGS